MAVFRHGKNASFKFGSAATPTTLVDRSDMFDEVGFPREVETAETTTFGVPGGAKTYIVGLSDATISGSGKFDNAGDTQIAALLGFDTPVSFEYGPEGTATGRVKYTGSFYVTSYEITASVGDVVAAKVEFQVTGPVVRGAF